MRIILIFLFLIQSGVCLADGAVAQAENSSTYFMDRNLSSEDAQSSALDRCKESAQRDCKIVSVFKNTCAAVAVSSATIYVATADSEEDAKSAAERICQKQSKGSSCNRGSSGCDNSFGVMSRQIDRSFLRSGARVPILLSMAGAIVFLIIVCGALAFRLYVSRPKTPSPVVSAPKEPTPARSPQVTPIEPEPAPATVTTTKTFDL
jgi:hypothetical protein